MQTEISRLQGYDLFQVLKYKTSSFLAGKDNQRNPVFLFFVGKDKQWSSTDSILYSHIMFFCIRSLGTSPLRGKYSQKTKFALIMEDVNPSESAH